MDNLEPEPDQTREQPTVEPLGPVELMTAAGPVIYFDARLITNGPVTRPDGKQLVTIMTVTPLRYDATNPHLIGGIAQFTPDEARTFAATLCQTADKIDGGGVKH
jgi:hypothetical protein